MRHLFFRPAGAVIAATLLVTAAQGQPAAPSAPPRVPAPAAAPTATHLALARELIAINGLARLADPFLPQFSAQIRKGAVTRPEMAKDLDQVLDKLKPEIDQQKQQIVETTARMYASSFTEFELRDLITFFRTPSGQKYLQLSPRILGDLDLEMRRWAERVSQQTMGRVRDEMGKRGHQM